MTILRFATSPQSPLPPSDSGQPNEVDRPGWSLPQGAPVFVAIGVLALILLLITFAAHTITPNSGTIDKVIAIAQENNSAGQLSHRTLTGVQVTIDNTSDKPIHIYSEKATVIPASGDPVTDEAAASVELQRYQEAFADLRQLSAPAIKPDTIIPPHSKLEGSLIFGFEIPKDGFDKRKNLRVTIVLDGDTPLQINERKK